MSCVERGAPAAARRSETRSDGVVISISVTSYNGGCDDSPLSGHFDETGGNIGRAENNQLVLPDPERTISRVHAQVVFRNGRYAIVDRGSNPISVNGRPLGNGQETLHPAGRRAPDRRLRDAGRGRRRRRGGAGRPTRSPTSPGSPPSTPPAAGRCCRRRPAPLRRSARGLRCCAARSGGASRRAPAGLPVVAGARRGGIPQDWDPFAPESRRPSRRTARTSPARSASRRAAAAAISASMSAAAPSR